MDAMTKNSLHSIHKYRHLLPLVAVVIGTMAHAEDQRVSEDSLMLDGISSVSLEDLASSRGKQGLDTLQQMNENDQRAWLENNKLDSGMTGNNVIESGALEGIEGISTVIQNTGNQVVIQESTLLNLTITP
jgi:hypothetical protein